MNWGVESLIATSLLMVLVLLVRKPVARVFGARAAYALWLAPLARLVLPAIPVEVEAFPSAVALEVLPLGQVEAAAAGADSASIVLILWGVGALLFLAWHALAYRNFVHDAVAKGRAVSVSDIKDCAVIETSAVTGPAATGLIVRRIFVPEDFTIRFAPEQQRLALSHEALHHRRGDLWASAVALLVLAFHWFNPLAHLAHRAFRRDLEAACDASLIDIFGGNTRAVYAQTILRCAGQPMPQTSCALTPIGELKGRLEMLNLHHGKARRIGGIALASALAGGSLFVAAPVAAQEDSSGEQTTRIDIRRMVTDGKGGPDQLRRTLPVDLREKMAKCDGEKFEVEVDMAPMPSAGGEPKKDRNRMLICAKGGSTKAETAAALEKVLSRLEGTDERPAEAKAEMVARIKARIAELKAGS